MTLFRNAIAEIRDLFKLAYGAPFEENRFPITSTTCELTGLRSLF
jgi:hypothetical protein